ncbi:MAG: hypothetical protein JO303_14955 [Caulobacteraceae bacterium]|nr:hypothetical protein [Caulobacteraceae bacterium]
MQSLMTGAQYKASLKDGRAVYFGGGRVDDVASHPAFAAAVDRAAEGYDQRRAGDEESFEPPRSVEALRRLARTTLDPIAGFTHTSLMTLLTAAQRIANRRPQAAAMVQAYVEEARAKGWSIAECISDSKGDRARHPGEQLDPDQYVRVVGRRADGVVIRGAKLHISGAAICHELMTIPTKAMRQGEEAYAIACMVPVDAKGVSIINTISGARPGDPRDAPISRRLELAQGFVVFDDVFVPHERVFLDGETDCAGAFAHSLGLWTRTRNLADACDDAELLVGFAQLAAEANGLEKIAHIREKISDLIINATLVRACFEAAIATARPDVNGTMVPDELFTNAGKHQAAASLSAMVQHLQDICGGSLVTAPSMSDLDNPETGAFVRKYMSGREGVDGTYRLRLFHAVRDLVASEFAGYTAVAKLHGGGGLYAQRVVTRGRYDMAAAKRKALAAAGLEPPAR